MSDNIVEVLIAVGVRFFTSLANIGIPLIGILVICSRINLYNVDDMENEEVQHAVLAELTIVKVVDWARAFSQFKHLKIGAGTRAYDVSLPQNDGICEYFTYDPRSGNLVPWLSLTGLRKIKGLYAMPG